jgi:hypothetical protein
VEADEVKAFLERWANEGGVVADSGGTVQQAEQKLEPETEMVHYALRGKAVLGKLSVERCQVGCGRLVSFYKHEGALYGYCGRCEVYQQIQNQ